MYCVAYTRGRGESRVGKTPRFYLNKLAVELRGPV
jgi:hypothetical protein